MNTLVRQVMSARPVTVTPDTTVPEAMKLMQDRGIRRLPVLRSDGRLVGIVTDRDLKQAMPSEATSLSIWELTYLMSRLPVRQVMTASVLTVSTEAPLKDAAYTMLKHRIGGMPVVNERNEVVGVVTVTDVLREFVGLPALA